MSEFEKENKKTATVLVHKAKLMQKREKRTFFFNAGVLSVYGWQLSIPVILGVILGRFLDKTFPDNFFSWTLNLILIGFAIGVFNANYWMHKEGVILQQKKKGKK